MVGGVSVRALVRETVAIKAAVGDGEVQIGEVSWPFGTPVVAVRDVYMPETVDVWGRFPGKSDQPLLRLRLDVRQGIPSFTRVEIESTPNGAEVTGVHLGLVRDILEWWRDVVVQRCAQSEPEHDLTSEPVWADSQAASVAVKQARRGAPRKATDARHERVAAIYRAHVDGKPLDAIRDAFRNANGDKISRRTAARYVEEARKAGHLPPTTPGKKKA